MSEEVQTIQKWGRPRNRVKTPIDDKGNVAEFFTHDEYGMALDPKFWAKKSCRDCSGRGFIWRAGTRKELKQTSPEGPAVEVEVPHREMHPCGCATRRYQEKRRVVEERLFFAKKRGGDEEECRELERIHAEHGHHVSFRKGDVEVSSPPPVTPSDAEDVSSEEIPTSPVLPTPVT